MGERGDNLTAGGARPCDCADVAAYLDGELGAAESASFESHLKSCALCAGALAEQRRLLSLLDAAFRPAPHRQVELPADFTRVAVARAQSDMTAVRRRSEHGRALGLCAALAAAAFALLGAQFWAEVAALVRPAAHAAAALSDITLHAAASGATGARVVLRGLGGYLLQSGPAGAPLLVYAALACGVLLLLGLIGKYHRAELPD
jgi:anti-sigma factor RsiW